MSASIAPRAIAVPRIVHIATNCGSLTAELTVPDDSRAIVILARTNAARRQARYDRKLADSLQAAGFATLMFDLLTPDEELIGDATRAMRTDTALLSRRLIEVIDWAADQPGIEGLDVGLLGEGAGAPAAFVASCVRPDRVTAIVSYAERLDRAATVLPRVQASTLLIVVGNDENELRSNDAGFRKLTCRKELVCVATGQYTSRMDAEREVSRLAFDWFWRMLSPDVVTAASAYG
jgi:putative phosphoribosyl transferase